MYRSHGVIDTQAICYELHIDRVEGKKLFADLLADGYIEKNTNDRPGFWAPYQLTPKCSRLLNVKFNKPISRRAADKILNTVVRRIEEAAADITEIYAVAYACVFGDYITSSSTIADVEVAIALHENPKYVPGEEETFSFDRYAEERGFENSIGNIYELPTKMLLERLRGHTKSLSLRPINNFNFIQAFDAGKTQEIYRDPNYAPFTEVMKTDRDIFTRHNQSMFAHRLSYTQMEEGGADSWETRGSVSPRYKPWPKDQSRFMIIGSIWHEFEASQYLGDLTNAKCIVSRQRPD